MRRLLSVAILLAALVVPCRAGADGADYAVPAGFVLPWECGQSYRVSWEPQDHWADGKATGIAWDLSMVEGTPLVAPFSGRAYFLSDLRPLETTYGHYVEIVDETGYWLVRLAHLQDAPFGERFVRTGELIGHSGSSGTASAHLHLELLVREGGEWVRPDLDSLTVVYGLPRQALVEGALVGRDGCAVAVGLVGPVGAPDSTVRLGQSVELRVSLANRSNDLVLVDLVQVALYSAYGDSLLAEASGAWSIGGGETLDVPVTARPPSPGAWYVGRVTWNTGAESAGAPARGQVYVADAPFRLVGFSGPGTEIPVGERPAMTLWVQNASDMDQAIDGLVIEGLRPDGASWQTRVEEGVTLPSGKVERFTLIPSAPLDRVGQWTITAVRYLVNGDAFVFGRLEGDMAVYGPELEVAAFSLYNSRETANVLMQVRNVGTEDATVDGLEVWGWKPNDESFFARISGVAPVRVGASALVQIAVPLEAVQGTWRFVEAGYWLGGNYYAMALPGQPAVAVGDAFVAERDQVPSGGAPANPHTAR